MAYMSQEKKKEIAASLKPILKKYQVKGTLSVEHHSTLHLTITESPIDFIGNYNKLSENRSPNAIDRHIEKDNLDINPYWYHEHFDGKALEFLKEIIPIMNNGNHNNSDIQSDYFDVGWYISVEIGKWNKPYKLIEESFCDRNMAGNHKGMNTATGVDESFMDLYCDAAGRCFSDADPGL